LESAEAQSAKAEAECGSVIPGLRRAPRGSIRATARRVGTWLRRFAHPTAVDDLMADAVKYIAQPMRGPQLEELLQLPTRR